MSDQTENDGEDVNELIAFRIAEQDFCFNIMSVREIRGWTPATVIPHAPSYVRGVINLRGAVVPIVDLAARLGLEVPEPTARNVIIITQVDGPIVGLLVDAVSDILSVSEKEVQATPDVASNGSEFLSGIITREDRMIRLLNLGAIVPEKAGVAA
ncbi:chemotaxis protein CheW [Psychromarinibacter halotolerans]|uniref:Chemotaxis protein CheW n=1 Tax=Psychromarinibacter halotolerans TaxID=1775175 RepID=A0ABV7GTG8_9RHOB|nr:chemotaxis protein CheW [Psychromarinibacter halotolerans]MAQ85591.1 chemotaxis protein CheW [Maritimibacter sp.]MDF0594538.1 chemotaxis protein CheW [Psychromarinibacter halotolerans]